MNNDSLINIINIVDSIREESNRLTEDEEAYLYMYLTEKDTNLQIVEGYLNRLKTNKAKLLYLRRFAVAPGMFLQIVCFIFANNTEYLLT